MERCAHCFLHRPDFEESAAVGLTTMPGSQQTEDMWVLEGGTPRIGGAVLETHNVVMHPTQLESYDDFWTVANGTPQLAGKLLQKDTKGRENSCA